MFSVPILPEALIRERVLGADHPDTALSVNNLGYLLQTQGDFVTARPYYERALAIRARVLGPDHPDTALSLNNLGGLLQVQGEYPAARPYFERALSILTVRLGQQHPNTQAVQRNLTALDTPRESREEQIARIYQQANITTTQALASDDMDQRIAAAAELERQARWAEDGEPEGSPYHVLATQLRAIKAQIDELTTH